MIEQDYSFACPHCGVTLSVRLEPIAGRNQQFIQDCEVCCRPIQIEARFEDGEITSFSAEPGD